MGVDSSRLAEAARSRQGGAIAGAVVCAGVSVVLALATALVTFGLSESYGFGPGWDWSAFVMTGGAAILSGAALVGAIRLARLQLRPFPVLVASVASVLALAYVAGVIGNTRHH